METTTVVNGGDEDAFRCMGAPRPDDVPPYTGPDLALRWQWSDAGARLAVVPVQADNGGDEDAFRGLGAPRQDDLPPYTGPDLALRWQWSDAGARLSVVPAEAEWPYTQRPEEEYYDEYDDEGPDYAARKNECGECMPDSEDERYAREPFDICERDHSSARWDEDYDY
jgi:hypothetical protein